MHLTIDGYDGDPRKLGDIELIRAFLDRFPDEIGMTRVAPPQVYTYRGQKPDDWGVSGFVLIAESHITVHTFPTRGYVNVDIFSCMWFDADESVEEVRRMLALSRVRSHVLERGLEYLDEEEAKFGMDAERSGLISGVPGR